MASVPVSYAGLLKKVSAAKLDTKKRNSKQRSELYRETIQRLTAILKKPVPWSNSDRNTASKELDTLTGILSEEDVKDSSIKDAVAAVKNIESKLSPQKIGERGLKPGDALKGTAITAGTSVQGNGTSPTSSANKQGGPGSNIPTKKSSGQIGGPRNTKPKQMIPPGPFDNEGFIAFLKELKSIIGEEKEHFSVEVFNWFQNGQNTEEMRQLIEQMKNQRSRIADLEKELRDQKDRLSSMNAISSKESQSPRADTTSKGKDAKAVESRNSKNERELHVKSEISLLADEISSSSINMSEFKQRIKTYPNDDGLTDLQSLRNTLEKRFESSSLVKSELELLEKEVEKGVYEDSTFEKRIKSLKDKSVELEHISKTRKSLKKWEDENKQMKTFITSLKERLKDGKFKKVSVTGEMQWQRDAQNLLDGLIVFVDRANSKSGEKIKTKVEKLTKYVESKTFDSAAEKWYTKLKNEQDAVMRSLGCIAEQNAVWVSLENQLNRLHEDIKSGNVNTDRYGKECETNLVSFVRQRLSESSKTTKEITNKISMLKEKLIPDETARPDVVVDEQWKSDLEAIEKKAASLTMERDELSESSKTTKEITNKISMLKRKLIPDETARPDVVVDEQWKSDLDAIEKKATSLTMERDDKSDEKIKTEVENLTKYVESKSFDSAATKWYTKLKNENDAVMRSLGCIAEQNAVWVSLERQLNRLHEDVKTGNVNTDRSGKEGGKDGEEMVVSFVRQRLSQSSNTIKEITSGILMLKRKIIPDETRGSDVVAGEQWKSDLDAIEKKTSSIQMKLAKVEGTCIEINEVNNEIEAIEGLLTAGYSGLQTNADARNNRRHAGNPNTPREALKHHLKTMVNRLEFIMASQKSAIESGKDEIRRLQQIIAETNDDLVRLQKSAKKLEGDAKKLQGDKNDLLTRLSSVAGARLVHENPNIADLSDPNRPTKIAEQYSEMYDSVWTDAYEVFGDNLGEKQICHQLLKILMDADKESRSIAEAQYRKICYSCLHPTKNKPGETHGTEEFKNLDVTHKKLINDLRKQTGQKSVKSVLQGIEDPSIHPKLMKYKKACIEICWYMSLQTPPVVIETPAKEKSKFDREKYKEYTKKGPKIDFVTWPPLLLHKDGPLLCKGVAQGQ